MTLSIRSCPPKALLLALAATLGPAARADDVAVAPLSPKYRQECAACHVAYPPGALSAASWQRLMADLPHHFGTDASLDAATVAELAGWLGQNAGSGPPAPQERITRSIWFVREHRKVPPAVWQRPAVKSAANCAACHAGADQGDFSEHRVRIPR
jgi:hypothetical protein